MFQSKKQKQLEKEQKEQREQEERKRKTNLFQWLGVLCFAILGIGTAPSFAMILFLLLGVALMPINPIKELWGESPH